MFRTEEEPAARLGGHANNRVNHRAPQQPCKRLSGTVTGHQRLRQHLCEGYEERSLIALCPSLEVCSPAARANMEAVVFLGVPGSLSPPVQKQPKMRLNLREREGAC